MTREPRRTLRIQAFPTAPGNHVTSWRLPAAHADVGLDFGHYRDLILTAERGLFEHGLVVPDMRRGGLFRTEYAGATPRGNLGPNRPAWAPPCPPGPPS